MLIVTVVGLVACFEKQGIKPEYSRVIARVGNDEIKEDLLRFRFKLELDKFPKQYVEQYRQKPLDEENRLKPVLDNVLNQMIESRCIIGYGEKKNIVISNDELQKRFVERQSQMDPKDLENILREEQVPYHRWKELVEGELRVQYVLEKAIGDSLKVSVAEISDYYHKNKSDFKHADEVRVRHIVTDTRAKAEEILKRIQSGENFAELAVKHSISPDRAQGGALGYYERGVYPTVFDKAFDMNHGEVSAIVESEYGFHIFKLLDKRPAGFKSLEEVAAVIQKKLFEEKLKSHYKMFINKARQEVSVKIIEENLKSFIL